MSCSFQACEEELTGHPTAHGQVLCVHGGLSPDIRSVDQIRIINRLCEIPHEGPFCDLVWSDPEDIETWAVSPRGAGWLFGGKVTQEFNYVNKLELICRYGHLERRCCPVCEMHSDSPEELIVGCAGRISLCRKG
eukprot:scaffold7408_cov417-Prasinococcus_capsulatus_cf.AAC.1